MSEYLNNFNSFPNHKVIKEMKKYAELNKVPIINDEALVLMLEVIDFLNAKRVLEIGTAIAYCSINLAVYKKDLVIDTIEKNEIMYQEALKNISNVKLEDRIDVYLADALEIDILNLKGDYDLIFIDAAKAQYIKFFEKFEKLLKNDGVIISDNLLFHGLVGSKDKVESKDLRSLISKIEDYNNYLTKHRSYNSRFYDIGDGIAISRRIKK